jgi:hypothetical protein
MLGGMNRRDRLGMHLGLGPGRGIFIGNYCFIQDKNSKISLIIVTNYC